jgi:hypothetical protein
MRARALFSGGSCYHHARMFLTDTHHPLVPPTRAANKNARRAL